MHSPTSVLPKCSPDTAPPHLSVPLGSWRRNPPLLGPRRRMQLQYTRAHHAPFLRFTGRSCAHFTPRSPMPAATHTHSWHVTGADGTDDRHCVSDACLSVLLCACVNCADEGDVMSRAGVAYTVGREANTTYGESMAGRLPVPPVWNCGANWNLGPVNGRGDDGKPLPMIDAVAPLAPLGSGDSKVRRTA
jgi:hypothetical protein